MARNLFAKTFAPLHDSIRLALLAAVLGAVVAYAALGFLLLIAALQAIFFGSIGGATYISLSAVPAWRIILAPTLGGLIVGLLVRRFVPGGRNYGPADVLEAVQDHDGRLPLRTGIGSALASAVSLGSGASLGRYGPAVHLGASLSSWLARQLKLSRGQRIALVGSGVAAAIAASFNAPLGGILFATEVMLGGRALRSFVPVTIAAVAATAIARTHGNDFHLSDLSAHNIGFLHEYAIFALTGAGAGLLAVALMKSMSFSASCVDASGLPRWSRPMLGGLVLGLLGTQYPHILGLGEQVIWDSFAGVFSVGLLVGLVVLKLAASSISYGFGFSGGVFGPALFVGAAFGSAVGLLLVGISPELISSPAIYALAAMGAVVSCVIGAPVATILIAFELTSSYSLATAVMLAVVLAHLVSRRVFPYSFFTQQLASRGVDVEIRREVQILKGGSLRDSLSAEFRALPGTMTISEALQHGLSNPNHNLLLVDDSGALLGEVTLARLVLTQQAGHGGDRVESVVESAKLVLEADTNLYQALIELRDFVGVSVPVVSDAASLRLLGVIHENTLISAYNDAVDQARDEERGLRGQQSGRVTNFAGIDRHHNPSRAVA